MWPRRRPSRPKNLAAVVGKDCEIEGRCRFTGVAIVEGRLACDRVTAEHLVIGDSGTVAGVIEATLVIVRGTVTGNIVAADRVELSATARVTGDIETPTLTMEAGAVVEGHCRTRMPTDAQPTGVLVPLSR